jgi:hypothetical protein
VPSSLGLGFGLVLDLGLGLGLALGLLVGFFAGLRLGMVGLQHWNGLSDLRYFRGAKGRLSAIAAVQLQIDRS